ncbi:MAG: hypothetical protein M1156_01420 [Candidatus Marsarchaeota archaeon]|jgi:DNA-directed RNA polymerase subunit L|nr:hypothetical protein [Candidatus Marsarchaeota archaeon]
MKLNIIEEEPKSIILEFEDADRGIAEIIKDKLINSTGVEFAGVIREHPEIGHPRLVIKASKSVRPILLKALDDLEEDIKDAVSQLPKQAKK